MEFSEAIKLLSLVFILIRHLLCFWLLVAWSGQLRQARANPAECLQSLHLINYETTTVLSQVIMPYEVMTETVARLIFFLFFDNSKVPVMV